MVWTCTEKRMNMTLSVWVGYGRCSRNCRAGGLEEEQKRRFMERMREDMKLLGVREEGAGDEQLQWKQMIG